MENDMAPTKVDLVKQEAIRFSKFQIANARGVTSTDDDEVEHREHMRTWVTGQAIAEKQLIELAIDGLYHGAYMGALNAAARSKKCRQGDLFASGLPEVIIIKGTKTYIRFDMATKAYLDIWIGQKRDNAEKIAKALESDTDAYNAIAEEIMAGANNAGEAIDNIRKKRGQAA